MPTLRLSGPPALSLTLPLALALGSSAVACPVKPGTMFHGLIPAVTAFRPECGAAYATFTKGASGAKWTELYVLRPPNDSDALIRAVLAKLVKTGFKQLSAVPKGKTMAYVFRKGKADIVVFTKRYPSGVLFTVSGR